MEFNLNELNTNKEKRKQYEFATDVIKNKIVREIYKEFNGLN